VTSLPLDLTSPTDCPDPQRDLEVGQEQLVQVLLKDSDVAITAFRCRINITKEVATCDQHFGITYGISTPVWEKVVELTPAECRRAMEREEVVVEGCTIRVYKGKTVASVFFTHGSVTADGECTTEKSFISEGITFQYSYQKVCVRASIDLVRGKIDTTTSMVHFKNGLRAKLTDLVIRDATEVVLGWDRPEPACQDQIAEVWTGKAELFRRRGSKAIQG